MVFYKADTIIITLNVTCTRYDIAENCSFGVNNHLLTHLCIVTWGQRRFMPCSRTFQHKLWLKPKIVADKDSMTTCKTFKILPIYDLLLNMINWLICWYLVSSIWDTYLNPLLTGSSVLKIHWSIPQRRHDIYTGVPNNAA